MLHIDRSKLPIYGKAHQGKYFGRIRKAIGNEARLFDPNNDLTLDIINLTIPNQPRIIIATPVAMGETFNYTDFEEIKSDKWDKIVDDIYYRLS